MNSSTLDNMTKSILVVKSISLLEPLFNKTCLITLNRTINFLLNFDDSLAVNNFYSRTWRYEMPSLVELKSTEFSLHCSTPLWQRKSCTIVTMLRMSKSRISRCTSNTPCYSTISASLYFAYTMLKTCSNTRWINSCRWRGRRGSLRWRGLGRLSRRRGRTRGKWPG
jgi:hypothetical protein